VATVTGFTADRMLEIENTTVVDGNVVGNNLILVTREGTQIDAGNVRGPQGPAGTPGTPGTPGALSGIQDENVDFPVRPKLNFIGTGVTLTDDAANTRTNVAIPTSTPAHVIQDEGTARTHRAGLNFVGAGVTASDDAANSRTNVTIPGVLPFVYYILDSTTMESGLFTTQTWTTWWSVNITVIGGNHYEFGWQNQCTHKVGTTPVLAALGVRVVYDGPNESAFQVNAAEINIPGPNVGSPIDFRCFHKAPTSGTATILWQAQRAWWSSVNVSIFQNAGMPRVLYVRNLGDSPI
jgi:hypothetical protein